MLNGIFDTVLGYTPACDVLSLAITIAVLILLRVSYVSKSKNFMYFCMMLASLLVASVTNLLHYRVLTDHSVSMKTVGYICYIVHTFALLFFMFNFLLYMLEPMLLDRKSYKRYAFAGFWICVADLVVVICGVVFGFGHVIHDDGTVTDEANPFLLAYVFMTALIVFVMVHYRDHLVKQLFNGVLFMMALAVLLIFMQINFGQRSFTVASFGLVTLAILFLVHSNPFDITTGAVGESAFDDMIADGYKKHKDIMVMSLHLPEFDSHTRMPSEITNLIRAMSTQYLKGAILFRIAGGRLVLAFHISKNPAYENGMNRMLLRFEDEYAHFRFDYKIVIGQTEEVLSRDNKYLTFLDFVESRMMMNDVKFFEKDDVEKFIRHEQILEEIKDIHKKSNLNDPRVLVYCQPVLNVATGKYDTAEALMRLSLDGIGMVYPDQFIPLAERYHLIHTLTLIILHKTCRMIRFLDENDYDVKRISVNFSVREFRDASFCSEVLSVIDSTEITPKKVGVEITESMSENDLPILKSKINELKEHGMTFYLDDFGTGYSNLERIMELPFDVIKFDRSLVLSIEKTKKSATMVDSQAQMFDELGYKVLFEGVEDEKDEVSCKRMHAKYLQGYKYSKPIPIEQLTEFFEKKGAD